MHKGMSVSTHRENTHKLHLQWEELFEWQVGGMAVSDCSDNGILVSLQIVPQEMAENCFWIKVKEEKFENPNLFAQLSLYFSSQSKGKEASSLFTRSLINLHTHASLSLSGNRCPAAFILWHLRNHFSHWNVNYLKTKHFFPCSWTLSMYALDSNLCAN